MMEVTDEKAYDLVVVVEETVNDLIGILDLEPVEIEQTKPNGEVIDWIIPNDIKLLKDYIKQHQSMAVENQQLKDEVNLLRGNKAKLAKMSYAQGYNAALKDIEKGSVVSPIGED